MRRSLIEQASLPEGCENIGRRGAGEQCCVEVAGVAQVCGGSIDDKAICGHPDGNISGKAGSLKNKDIARCHRKDATRIRINCIAILGLGKTIGEVEFGEHIRAIEEPVIGSEEKRNAGLKQLPYRRKRQPEGSIGTRDRKSVV